MSPSWVCDTKICLCVKRSNSGKRKVLKAYRIFSETNRLSVFAQLVQVQKTESIFVLQHCRIITSMKEMSKGKIYEGPYSGAGETGYHDTTKINNYKENLPSLMWDAELIKGT